MNSTIFYLFLLFLTKTIVVDTQTKFCTSACYPPSTLPFFLLFSSFFKKSLCTVNNFPVIQGERERGRGRGKCLKPMRLMVATLHLHIFIFSTQEAIKLKVDLKYNNPLVNSVPLVQ